MIAQVPPSFVMQTLESQMSHPLIPYGSPDYCRGFNDGVRAARVNMEHTAAYAKGNQASMQAAKGVEYKLSGIRARVYDYILTSSHYGATGSEIAEALGLLANTAKPRCTELKKAGLIVDTGRLRKNNNGKNETVWAIKGF